MTDAAVPRASTARIAIVPSLADLFLGFATVSVTGFGSVIAVTRQLMVERRRWVTNGEFDEMLGPAVFLPGAMTPNLAVIYGHRTHGVAGVVVSLVGLFAFPTALVLVLTALYERYGNIGVVQAALAGITPAAAGLLFATAAHLAEPHARRRDRMGIAAMGAAFVAVALLHLSLPIALVVVAPFSIYAAWRGAR